MQQNSDSFTKSDKTSNVLPRLLRRGQSCRQGFTLIELLVAMAIIGLLVALLLPAVQQARESARQASCRNNHKQLALAWHNHDASNGFFPTGGWGSRWIGIPELAFGKKQPGGWTYSCLPFMDQAALFHLGGSPSALLAQSRVSLSILHCPSRRAAILYPCDPTVVFFEAGYSPEVSRCDFAANCGNGTRNQGNNGVPAGPSTRAQGLSPSYAWDMTDLNGVSFLHSEVRLAEITDGLSATIMLGEKYLNPDNYATGLDGADNENAFTGWDNDLNRVTGVVPVHDQRGVINTIAFGSAHVGVFFVALCDGSVRGVSYQVDGTIWKALGSRNGGETIGDF